MTAKQRPDLASETPADDWVRKLSKLVGAVLSGAVLVIGNLAALFFTVVSWLMVPTGPGDSNHIEGAWFTAFMGTVLALLTALLTIIPVMARWLRKRWFIVPAVLFAVATTRWVYIDAVYPEEPDKYRFGQVSVIVNGESHI